MGVAQIEQINNKTELKDYRLVKTVSAVKLTSLIHEIKVFEFLLSYAIQTVFYFLFFPVEFKRSSSRWNLNISCFLLIRMTYLPLITIVI